LNDESGKSPSLTLKYFLELNLSLFTFI